MNYDYKILKPFKWFVLQNFPFIEADFDEITNWQLFCKLGEEINKVINSINLTSEQVENLTNAFNDLTNYVNNYFENLDVQDEINNKLDEMVESGTLADIINQQIFDDLNDAINANTENINNLRNDTITYPFYDIKKNGGNDDGTTPNDTIFTNAKNNGYRKFYFPQNADNNANYYFTETPDFNDCEIITDDGVIINFPNPSGINSTHNAKFKNNVKMYSRQQSRSFNIAKNESDFFNQFSLPNYTMKKTLIHQLGSNTLRMFHYSYNDGIYQESNKNTYFQTIGYDIRYKANDINSQYSILAIPFNTNKNECIEIVTTPNTHINFGCVDTNSMHGMYCQYIGSSDGGYFAVNGTPNQQLSYNYSTLSNIFSHNGQSGFNNNWALPMKYKLRNDIVMKQIQLFVNDNFVQSIPYTVSPDYWGFGINEGASTLSSDIGFSEILQYEQEVCPLNSSLNILIAGDSRMYGYNSQYHIEDIIENGLKNNGINVASITNISVSGWTIDNIYDAIRAQDLSQYDIVIVPTGINNLYSSYQSILEVAFNLQNYCANNRCFCIMPATMPVGYGATDALANQRAEVYYRIQQAILSSNGYGGVNRRLCQIIPNVMGTTVLSNNIEVCSDGVHPTTEGTILFAKSIVNTILHILD